MVGRGEADVPLVVLGSGSPRRAAILRRLGIEPEIRPTDVDETVRAGEPAADLVVRLADAKLTACCRLLGPTSRSVLAIAADTVVEVGGSIMGKPVGKADAERMLTTLSGRDHRVVTGMAVGLIETGADPLADADPVHRVSGYETTVVSFRPLDRELIDWYVETGEAFDKAGSYGIQGRGALLVDGVNGSYLNIVGLPVVALDNLCRRLGLPLHRLATGSNTAARIAAEMGSGHDGR